MICIYWPAAGSDSSGFWLHEISVELWKVISCRFAVVQPVAQTKFFQLSRGGAVMTDVSWVTWVCPKIMSDLALNAMFERKKLVCVFFEIFWSWIFYSDSSGESLKIFEPTLKLQCILRMVSIGRWSPLCQWNTRNMCREENFTKQSAVDGRGLPIPQFCGRQRISTRYAPNPPFLLGDSRSGILWLFGLASFGPRWWRRNSWRCPASCSSGDIWSRRSPRSPGWGNHILRSY